MPSPYVIALILLVGAGLLVMIWADDRQDDRRRKAKAEFEEPKKKYPNVDEDETRS